MDVDSGQHSQFAVAIIAQLLAFPPNIRPFGIGLRADRYIFSRSHRHRAGDKPRNAGDQDALMCPLALATLKCFHSFPFLKLQDIFDDAVGELASRGSI